MSKYDSVHFSMFKRFFIQPYVGFRIAFSILNLLFFWIFFALLKMNFTDHHFEYVCMFSCTKLMVKSIYIQSQPSLHHRARDWSKSGGWHQSEHPNFRASALPKARAWWKPLQWLVCVLVWIFFWSMWASFVFRIYIVQQNFVGFSEASEFQYDRWQTPGPESVLLKPVISVCVFVCSFFYFYFCSSWNLNFWWRSQ